MKKGKFNLILSIILLSFSICLVSAQNIMTIEVDILDDEATEENSVSIEVPDSLYMGEIGESGVTDKFQIFVNNTGNVDITITPELVSPYDPVFDNLFFQNRKTGNNSEEFRIGNYSFNIAKPPASGKRSEYFWMWLDLENYNQDIEQDMIGEKADIRFIALPRV